jgi:hypothetical protein
LFDLAEWRVERCVVLDGQIVAGALINRLENFLQRDDRVGVAALEWDWDRWQFVAKCPCVDLAAWSTIRSTDDRVKVAWRERSSHRQTRTTTEEIEFDKVECLFKKLLALCQIFTAAISVAAFVGRRK